MKTPILHILSATRRAFAIALVLTLGNTIATAQYLARHSELISIGDSLSDIGRFYSATGDTQPPFPYYEGRFSNGPVWIEYLADLLETDLDPEGQFAMGGAMTGPDNLQSMPPVFVLPGFEQQVDGVLSLNGHRRVDPRAIYTVWIGANDFFAWLASGNSDPTGMIQDGVANTIEGINDLADAGAAHFVVINLPDLGVTPAAGALPPGVDGLLSVLSASYNALLDQQLDLLEEEQHVTIVRISAFELINDIVANPGDYGLSNVTDMAIAGLPGVDPDEYLFWDNVHPTTVAHQIIAETVYAGICQNYPVGKRKAQAGHFRSKPVRAALSSKLVK
jgi:thermolabile hemolysin